MFTSGHGVNKVYIQLIQLWFIGKQIFCFVTAVTTLPFVWWSPRWILTWEVTPGFCIFASSAWIEKLGQGYMFLTSWCETQTMPLELSQSEGFSKWQIVEWKGADCWRWWTNRAVTSKGGGRELRLDHWWWGQTVRAFLQLKGSGWLIFLWN